MEYKFRAWIEAIKCMLYKVDVYANGNIGITYANVPEELFKLYYVDWDDSCIRECGTDIHVINILTVEEYIWFESGFVLMHYIGIQGKANVDLYTGDIVTAMSAGSKGTFEIWYRKEGAPCYILYPAWQNGEFWHIHASEHKKGKQFIDVTAKITTTDKEGFFDDGIQVIGNKYQHPHLLPQNNKKGGA